MRRVLPMSDEEEWVRLIIGKAIKSAGIKDDRGVLENRIYDALGDRQARSALRGWLFPSLRKSDEERLERRRRARQQREERDRRNDIEAVLEGDDEYPPWRAILTRWEYDDAAVSSRAAKRQYEELEQLKEQLHLVRDLYLNVVLSFAFQAQEEWLKVVNLLRSYATYQPSHLNVVPDEKDRR